MEQDGKNISLPYRDPEKASRTIGYRLALTGQAASEVEYQRQEGHNATMQAIQGCLPKQDMLRMYFNVMTPGRQYALIPHLLTSDQIDSIQAKSITLLLRSLNFCSTSKRVILHGPKRYGCATFKRWSTEVLAKQASRLLTELYNNDRNGKDLQSVMSCIQRDICTSVPFMTLPFDEWGFLTGNSWVTSIWKRLSQHNIKLHGG